MMSFHRDHLLPGTENAEWDMLFHSARRIKFAFPASQLMPFAVAASLAGQHGVCLTPF